MYSVKKILINEGISRYEVEYIIKFMEMINLSISLEMNQTNRAIYKINCIR